LKYDETKKEILLKKIDKLTNANTNDETIGSLLGYTDIQNRFIEFKENINRKFKEE
jgi:hypothetical protein